MRSAGHRLVDGQGARRVVARLRSELLQLRLATSDDARLLFGWANDSVVRRSSFSPTPISWDDHVPWLRNRLSSGRTWIFVGSDRDGSPVGQVRFDATPPVSSDGHTLDVDVSIAAEHRGRRLAAPLIRRGVTEILRGQTPATIRALVRADNVPSRRAFVAADFDDVGIHTFAGTTVHEYRFAGRA
jgi:RimJ/RimL family protein N-acetyltransferase